MVVDKTMVTEEEFDQLKNVMVGIIESLVPVGSVVPFWGKVSEIPKTFQLCNGDAITDPAAKIAGNTPDLTEHFLKGAKRDVEDVRNVGPEGSNTINGLKCIGTALNESQMPSHSHPGSSPPHHHPNNVDFIFNEGGGGGERLIIPTAHRRPGGVPSPGHPGTRVVPMPGMGSFSVSTGDRYLCGASDMTGEASASVDIGPVGGNQPHEHLLPDLDNRPACRSVLYIIRIK